MLGLKLIHINKKGSQIPPHAMKQVLALKYIFEYAAFSFFNAEYRQKVFA